VWSGCGTAFRIPFMIHTALPCSYSVRVNIANPKVGTGKGPDLFPWRRIWAFLRHQ